jgi:hypothetical protein
MVRTGSPSENGQRGYYRIKKPRSNKQVHKAL